MPVAEDPRLGLQGKQGEGQNFLLAHVLVFAVNCKMEHCHAKHKSALSC